MQEVVSLIDRMDSAAALLSPVRIRILELLREPASAATVARELELPRQRVNYHVKALERAGLLRRVGQRRKGNLVEKLVQATARYYVIAPQALGALGPELENSGDRLSSAYLIGMVSEAIRDVATLRKRTSPAESGLATLSLNAAVRFADVTAQNAFAQELATCLVRLVKEYDDSQSDDGQSDYGPSDDGLSFRFLMAGYPTVTRRIPEDPAQPELRWPDAIDDERDPEDSTRSIELEVEIDAPPESVWKAISEGEEVRRWFSPEARMTPGVGGSIWLSWGPGVEGEGVIDVWKPGRRLRWVESWGSAYDVDSAGDESSSIDVRTAVDFRIETRAGRTIARLAHSGFSPSPDWDEYYDATVAGWTYFLRNLAFYVERHFGTARTMVCERRGTTRSFAEIWSELFGPSGLSVQGIEDLASGDRLALTLGDLTLRGDVKYVRYPRNLAATLEELNDGLLFVEMEPSGGEAWSCGIWISAYGVPAEQTAALQAQLTALADRVFG